METKTVTSRPARGAVNQKTRSRLAPFMREFAEDESGVLVAFSVYFMLMILFVGAVGVDVMRFEADRTRLQHTLDQAVLAAADLDQRQPPAQVVQDYFDKSGLDNAVLTSTVVDEGLNYRDVRATAEQIVNTQIVHMLGIDSMTAPAASAAEERVDSVEISLVLDVSGSMRGSRLANLKPAAREFVTTVLGLSEAEDISVSIVPYATQVAIGSALEAQFDTHDDHDYSYCFNFDGADFQSTTMSPAGYGRSYERTQHFDPWRELEDPNGLSYLTPGRTWYNSVPLTVCSDRPASQILPLSNNETDLHTQINGLYADGNTSADIGVKWGAALLDPSLQPVVTALTASGEIDDVFDGRPLSYADPNSIKVMVVMTDGQNTSQYVLRDQFRSGDSDVYYNSSADRYAVRYNNRYYYQSNSGHQSVSTSHWRWNLSSIPVSGSWERLSYQDLFATNSNEFIDDVLYRYIGSYNWDSGPRWAVSGGVKDSRMQDICTASKNRGIVIYTIGFEAPDHGADELEECASSPSHFFDVDGLEISEAFSAIAQSISQLKLTQ